MSDTQRTASIETIRGEILPLGGWTKRVADVLSRMRVQTFGDLEARSPHELLSNHGFSQQGLAFVRKELTRRGLSLRGQQPPRESYRTKPESSGSVTGVYFIRCVDFIKIGHATDVRKRFSEIAVSIPFDLELEAIDECSSKRAAVAQERALHQQFSSLRRRGEWFHRHSPLIEYINLRRCRVP